MWRKILAVVLFLMPVRFVWVVISGGGLPGANSGQQIASVVWALLFTLAGIYLWRRASKAS